MSSFNKSRTLFFLILLIAFSCQHENTSVEKQPVVVISDSLPWSERMAQSIMKRHEKAWQAENDAAPEWDYKIGLLMTAFENLYIKTNTEVYFDYVKHYAETVVDSTGHMKDYQLEHYNIDNINPGKFLFFMYEKTKDERYRIAMQTLRTQLQGHPRTNAGGFWHKKIYPYQMWLDGLYMGTPFYARYNVSFENGDKIDDIIHQFEQIQIHLVDEQTGLLFHAWDESKAMNWANKETGRSPGFWTRSLGWYAMALVDVLDYIPENHTKRKRLILYLNSLMSALVEVQDQDTGLWWQVPDQGGREGNYLEASSSCMLAYAMAKGARKGYLDDGYQAVAEKCFDGVITQLIEVDEDGEIHITQICGSAGLGGNPYRSGTYDYYINEEIKVDNLHGTGPFILAALELNR